MAWKIDKQGRRYAACHDLDTDMGFCIYWPIRYFDRWVVTRDGIQHFDHQRVYIRAHQLDEPDWVEHYDGKGWDTDGLRRALKYARQYQRRAVAEKAARRRGLVPKRR